MKRSIDAMLDPRAAARFIDDNFDDIAELIQFNQLHMGGAELIEGLQKGGLLNSAFRGLENFRPTAGIGRGAAAVTGGIERQFDTFLIASKVQLWQAMKPMALASPNPQQAMQELAFSIAKMTGTISMANLGITPTTRQALGTFAMFAPRYRIASTALMTDVLRSGVTGQVARERLSKMLLGGLTAYSYIAHRAGQKPNLDPRSSKFMTLQVGKDNIGVGGVWISTARFAIGGMHQAVTEPGEFFRVDRGDSRLTAFIRGQLAPLTGTAWDMASGRNYIGEPTRGDVGDIANNVVLQGLLPFWASGFADYPKPGWSAPPAEFIGMRTFPVSFYDQAIQLADVYSHRQHNKNYKDLNRLQQLELLKEQPDVQALFDESNKVWGPRSVGFRGDLFDFRTETATLRKEYTDDLNRWIAAFETQQIDGKRFRAELKDLGLSHADANERLRNKFPEVMEAFDEQKDNPDAHLEDLAYNDYIATVIAPEFQVDDPEDTNFMGFDFQARDEAVARFRLRWGEGLENYVLERRDAARDTPPLLQELYRGRELLRPYWDVGELLLKRGGREDMLPRWRDYQRAVLTEEKEVLAKEFPILKQTAAAVRTARLRRRENHAPTDAFLFRWGYTPTLRNPENEAKDPDEVRRTPVRFE